MSKLACVLVTELSVANALALADAVLDDERVRLALAVHEGGPFAVRRAIELAALILAEPTAREGSMGVDLAPRFGASIVDDTAALLRVRPSDHARKQER